MPGSSGGCSASRNKVGCRVDYSLQYGGTFTSDFRGARAKLRYNMQTRAVLDALVYSAVERHIIYHGSVASSVFFRFGGQFQSKATTAVIPTTALPTYTTVMTAPFYALSLWPAYLCCPNYVPRRQVLCLRGASPARPHQEWLQEGTSSSRLRLQVGRSRTLGYLMHSCYVET